MILYSTVSPHGSVTVTPYQIDAERNMSRIFECSGEGGPGNRFSWSKLPDGVTITESLGLVIMVDSASVGGIYQCTVENMAGSASATALLNGKVFFFVSVLQSAIFSVLFTHSLQLFKSLANLRRTLM